MSVGIVDQLKLEHSQLQAGIKRYTDMQVSLASKGRGNETSYGRVYIPRFFDPMYKELERRRNNKGAGRRRLYLKLVESLSSEVLCTLTLRTVFDSLTRDIKQYQLVHAIGSRIHDELRFSHFRETSKDYYKEIIADFKRSGTVSQRHKHRVLVHSMNKTGIKWNSWSPREMVQVGTSMLDVLMSSSDLVEISHKRGKKGIVPIVIPTESTLDLIEQHMEEFEVLAPEFGPTIIKPSEWDGSHLYAGGYYSAELSCRVPMVKLHGKRHRTSLKGADLSYVAKAINLYQNTPYKINQKVYDVIRDVFRNNLEIALPSSEKLEIPPSPIPRDVDVSTLDEETKAEFEGWKSDASAVYRLENERRAHAANLVRVLKMADTYRAYDLFHYVIQVDSRSRAYPASAGLHYQATDYVRALLQFQRGVPLTEEGLYWLRIHGANTFGVDKEIFSTRVQWVIDHEEQILATANDPIDMKGFWGGSDKPYMFLAFCFEYARYKEEGLGMLTYLPCGVDGTCNGLQNLSAIGRDEIGAVATNLQDTGKVQDIYTLVLDKLMAKLKESNEPHAQVWLSLDVNRKLTKRPVMVLPYGGTERSCLDYVMDWVKDYERKHGNQWNTFRERLDDARFLSEMLWDAINETVVAARKIMDWLQGCAKVMAKHNLPIICHSPTGFRMYQGRYNDKQNHVDTVFGETVYRPHYYTKTDKINSLKQQQGIAPNFIHLHDASHMYITTHYCYDRYGIEDYLMVHDDFATHASNVPKLNLCIRDAFYDMYTENDVLLNFKEELEAQLPEDVKLPNPPPKGNFDLALVKQSPYFFG